MGPGLLDCTEWDRVNNGRASACKIDVLAKFVDLNHSEVDLRPHSEVDKSSRTWRRET